MKIRPARFDDVDEIVRLRREAAQWLASVGTDQWAGAGRGIDTEEFARRVRQSISAGETWIAEGDQGEAFGTIAIDRYTNPGLWTEDELRDSLIIHRMIKDRRAPDGVGDLLLDHADHVARSAGAKWLRLDAWTTNAALHRYYQSQGFEHVRTVEGHHTASAALFARPVLDQPGDDRHAHEASTKEGRRA
ncbi:hypothetical protein REH65_33380 (plasmid) [Saccharopolyspora sp. ID03-671]|uniref:hypothetical protein n=1 Tax=Saccharopolyspora sp. ID03-671 TaxID=3073066 RepID=UPI0030F416C7